MAESVRTLLLGGRRVGVTRFGSVGGWPLVWCHGGLSSSLDAELLDLAARRHGADVVAIDRPGIGHSDAWSAATPAEWASIVGLVADKLEIESFAVAGWSAGGPYALACAATMPDRVRAVATLAGIAPLATRREVRELGFFADKLLIFAARKSTRTTIPMLWLGTSLLGCVPDSVLGWALRRTAGTRDATALNAERLGIVVAAIRNSTIEGVRGTAEDYRRFGATSWGFSLDQIHQPVSIWQGAQDIMVPISQAQRLAARLPNSRLNIVPATGHYLPAVVADSVILDLAPN